jgi:hypothetical protein
MVRLAKCTAGNQGYFHFVIISVTSTLGGVLDEPDFSGANLQRNDESLEYQLDECVQKIMSIASEKAFLRTKIENLNEEKKRAVEIEDYDTAKKCKLEVESLQESILSRNIIYGRSSLDFCAYGIRYTSACAFFTSSGSIEM